MTVYVLVHGAWHGGWCWRETARALRAAGHEVYTPTLTGLADRSHLMSETVDLSTHVADVVGLIKWEELQDVVLVGHSYAGKIITGVADQIPAAIAALVYLDAQVPGVTGPLPPAVAEGLGFPPPPAAFFGVAEAHRERVDRLMTPQPAACRLQQWIPTGGADTVPRRAFYAAFGWESGERSRATLEQLKADPRWELRSTEQGHDLMVDDPDGLAEYLLGFSSV
jgi:pimeloyl-ACP methyl ester carboxylesterase